MNGARNVTSNSRTIKALFIAFAVEIIPSCVWYVTLPHTFAVAGYLPWLWKLIAGVLLGYLDHTRFIRNAMLLGVFTGISFGVIHWSAGMLGAPVDFGTASSTVAIAVLATPIYIVVALAGGGIGKLLARLR